MNQIVSKEYKRIEKKMVVKEYEDLKNVDNEEMK
jgi:hypothetical protein